MDSAPSPVGAATRRRRSNVELKDLEAPFRAQCAAAGLSLNQGLRQLVAASLAPAGQGRPAEPATRERAGHRETRRVRVEIRLGESERLAAQALAEQEGFALNSWIASLVHARLAGGPQFGEQELEALARSNYELLALGRNLNQIARALNVDAGNRGVYRPELVEEIRSLIQSHTRTVAAMVAANVERWQVSR